MITVHRYPSAWHAAVDHLEHAGVDTVFGLPADDLGLLKALEPTELRMILCRDQRNAAFMATGYALQSGRCGVCVVGKGPATTNVLTGLLEARCSAVPVLVLAAGTAVDRLGSGAFQELDQLALVRPMVKWAYRADTPDRLVPALEKAMRIATHGVPGPVYLEIPDHLLDAEVVRERPWSPVLDIQRLRPDPEAAADALRVIRASRRPILLVGGGMRHSAAAGSLERFAERVGAAVFTTASGRGGYDEDHRHFCGLAGLYAPPETYELWRRTDLVIALGSRLEETATFRPGFAAASVPVLQVNIDAAEISAEYIGPMVLGDGDAVVQTWCQALAAEPTRPQVDWPLQIMHCRQQAHRRVRDRLAQLAGSAGIHVAEVLSTLDTVVAGHRVLVQENGLQDMWSYFYPFWRCQGSAGSIVPSEQTSLGFGAAAAAGVRLADPNRPVIAFVGDGAFGMLGNDLATLADNHIGVLYLVLRNGGYGWLQSQWDKAAGGDTRFGFVSGEVRSTIPAIQHRDIHHAVVTERADLAEQLVRALVECDSGRVAVVEIPVELADVPADLTDLEGDFPTPAVT